jgi:hypothetical protein
MKQRISFLAFLTCILVLTACSETADKSSLQNNQTASDFAVDSVTNQPVISFFDSIAPDTLCGKYTGDFGKSFIHINLTHASKNKVVGYDINRGLQRNLVGNITEEKDALILTLEEPGDHKYDGKFTLTLSKRDFSVNGTWEGNDKKLAKKTFLLKKGTGKELIKEKKLNAPDNQITREDEFLETFNSSTSAQGYCDFQEDGLVVFHQFSNEDENSSGNQETTIKGSWRWLKNKQLEISWEKNDFFKKGNHRVPITYDKEYGYSSILIEGVEFSHRF